jgi:hypothetical protein
MAIKGDDMMSRPTEDNRERVHPVADVNKSKRAVQSNTFGRMTFSPATKKRQTSATTNDDN